MALKAHSRPRGLCIVFSLLLVVHLLGFPTVSQARNILIAMESTEGDPGDGVLSPSPKIIHFDPALLISSVAGSAWNEHPGTTRNGRYPSTATLLFYGPPGKFGGWLVPVFLPQPDGLPGQGRWHHAP
jgi:hypothetical protein|nr:hypothetical protein [Candidatus Krumholzibacteria bacterium]